MGPCLIREVGLDDFQMSVPNSTIMEFCDDVSHSSGGYS